MASNNKCAACKATIKNKDFIICCVCELKYDLNCVNVKKPNNSSADREVRRTWKCPTCRTRLTPPNDTTDLEEHSNVTTRSKQHLSLNESDCRDSITSSKDIRLIINHELTNIVRQHVTSDLKQIKHEISSFKEAMDFFNKQYEDLKKVVEEKATIISKLESDNISLLSTVAELSNRLGATEQHMRECNLEINGIPEHRTENLIQTMSQLSRSIDNPLNEDDILRATRVAKLNKNDKPRTVIVKMRTPRLRDSILAAVVRFNKKNYADKLNSHHLGLAGPRTPVFVAEHLTPSNKALHAATRKKCKEMNFKFVWVRNGHIFARKDESSSAISIRNMDSLRFIA